MGIYDVIGDRGQAIAALALSEWHGAQPLFKACFLGDKWPIVDFFVQLEGSDSVTPFFLAQVRSTRRAASVPGRLPVGLTAGELTALAAYRVPVYLIGVDERDRHAYLVSAPARDRGFRDMTTRYPLNGETREDLWNEVQAFWNRAIDVPASRFLDERWS